MTEKRENSYYKDIEDFTDIGEGIEIISNSFLTHFQVIDSLREL